MKAKKMEQQSSEKRNSWAYNSNKYRAVSTVPKYSDENKPKKERRDFTLGNLPYRTFGTDESV